MRKTKGGEGNGGFERGRMQEGGGGGGRRLWKDMEGSHLKYTEA